MISNQFYKAEIDRKQDILFQHMVYISKKYIIQGIYLLYEFKSIRFYSRRVTLQETYAICKTLSIYFFICSYCMACSTQPQPRKGIVHASIGKVSFESDKILGNANELLQTLVKLKPSSAKGVYIKSVSLSSTMSPSIPVEFKDV